MYKAISKGFVEKRSTSVRNSYETRVSEQQLIYNTLNRNLGETL